MGPADLSQILKVLPELNDERFYSGSDDATVFRINDQSAMVQTVDFITPVLNDPYCFGAVAAANALSDIYAMGATPLFALNIVCFPVRSLPLNILEEVLRGGASVLSEVQAVIAGGHSIEDNAPKYGMVVNGMANPDSLVYKKGARIGDKLFLTKPLGSGILTTAIDRELADEVLEQKIYHIMVHLNRGASLAMVKVGVNACTDITGFGLLGHLHEMLLASGVSAQISANSVPIMDEVWEFAKSGVVPAGTHNNLRYLVDKVQWSDEVPMPTRVVLCDAQTSGGLLIAVSPEKADELQNQLKEANCLSSVCIGEVVAGVAGKIQITL